MRKRCTATRKVNNIQAILLSVATCGFVGYIPGAPGTYASILGCAILYMLPVASLFSSVVLVFVVAAISLISVNNLTYDGEDPPYIVIDELAGMFVAMAGHQVTLLSLFIGFILFRFFDIIKPYPIRRFEHLKGGYGVVADDIVAGIFANFLLWLGYFALGMFGSR
jgi:phosphatidylglycerophosphatase A